MNNKLYNIDRWLIHLGQIKFGFDEVKIGLILPNNCKKRVFSKDSAFLRGAVVIQTYLTVDAHDVGQTISKSPIKPSGRN